VQDVSRAELDDKTAQLEQEHRFLDDLSRIEPETLWRLRPGQPPNVTAYLVLKDAASIFEWLTGKKAARGVNRSDATESGPFHRFVSVLWPAIFENGTSGLPAAMKNWAQWHSKHQERSALMTNMASRNPTWGLFEK
jgi:hypothetical protein